MNKVRITKTVVVKGLGIQHPGAIVEVSKQDESFLIAQGMGELLSEFDPPAKGRKKRVITKDELKKRVASKND